jgi:hypothetical protein
MCCPPHLPISNTPRYKFLCRLCGGRFLGAADKYLSKYAANDEVRETFTVEFIVGQAGRLGQETIYFHLGI